MGQPLPYIDATYGDLAEFALQDGLTINALHYGGFTAGPVARTRFCQKKGGNCRVVKDLGKVGTAVGLGGFKGAGTSATLVVPITKRIAATALVGYSRLLSDAANGRLVRGGAGFTNHFIGASS